MLMLFRQPQVTKTPNILPKDPDQQFLTTV